MGQMVDDVRLTVAGRRPVDFYGRTGGVIPTWWRCWRKLAGYERSNRRVRERRGVGHGRQGNESRVRTTPCAPARRHQLLPWAAPTASSHRLVAEVHRRAGRGRLHRGRRPGRLHRHCAYDFFSCDMIEAAHGRAPAVATGGQARAARTAWCSPTRATATWRSIGTAEIGPRGHARREHHRRSSSTTPIYGMTGGQMAPTSLPNQVTQTSPYGRNDSRRPASPCACASF